MDTAFEAFRQALLEAGRTNAPLVTATLDLSQTHDGHGPSVRVVWPHAFGAAHDRLGANDEHGLKSLKEEREAIEAAVADATATGALGLAYLGCAADGIRHELTTPLPFRNDVRMGRRGWPFEFERYRYLSQHRVALVLADLHTVDVLLVQHGEVEAKEEVDYDAHALSKRGGRSDVQGRGGPTEAGLSAGHSKNKVQQSVEAHQAMFAKEAAEKIEGLVAEHDTLLIVAGAEEARGNLLNELPERLREHAIERPAIHPVPGERELTMLASQLAIEHQYAVADEAAERWLSGAAAERDARGPEAVLRAAEQGRLAELVIHEDAVSHWGTADDARQHEAPGDDELFDRLLREAIRTSTVARFGRYEPVLREQGGVVGLLRW